MATATGDKYVVLHVMVEDWPQGTVISGDQLKRQIPAQGDRPAQTVEMKERLLSLGAIRPARGDEGNLEKVPIPTGGLSTAAQMRLATLDAQAEQLSRTLASLNERLTFHRTARPEVAAKAEALEEKDPAFEEAVRQRQAKVDALTAQAEAMAKELAELEKASSTGAAQAPAGGPHPAGAEHPKRKPGAP